jgi:hypothetical protein
MVHVYRDQPAQSSRVDDLIGVVCIVSFFAVPLVLLIAHGARQGFSGDDKGGIAIVLCFDLVVAWAFYIHVRRDCFEIRLSDFGTCEFVTRRRVIRLHVAEISAVEYKRDSDGDESYTVRYRGGRIEVRTSIADFRGFLTQLRALNPAVDLSSFPDRLRPVGVTPRPSGRLDRLGARYARWGARWAALLIVISGSGSHPLPAGDGRSCYGSPGGALRLALSRRHGGRGLLRRLGGRVPRAGALKAPPRDRSHFGCQRAGAAPLSPDGARPVRPDTRRVDL